MKSGYVKGLIALKSNTRKLLLRKRESLRRVIILRKSSIISDLIGKCDFYGNSKTVMFYYPHGNEVDLRKLMSLALKGRKRIVFPYIKKGRITICAKEVISLKNDMSPGEYGIMSPNAERCATVDSKSIDVVLVPGIAFDSRGHRIGYGKGYFDRWLKKIPIRKRVGIAYSFQVLKAVPHDTNDQRVGSIITENGIINILKQRKRSDR